MFPEEASLNPSGRNLENVSYPYQYFPDGLTWDLANLLRRTFWCSLSLIRKFQNLQPIRWPQSAVPIFSEDLGPLYPTALRLSTDTLHVPTAGASPLDLLSTSFPPSPLQQSYTGKTKITATKVVSLTIKPAEASLRKPQNHDDHTK